MTLRYFVTQSCTTAPRTAAYACDPSHAQVGMAAFFCPRLLSSRRQCPGTIIDRNFQVGTSLSVSFTVNGTAPLTALCDGTTSNTGAGDNQTLVEIVGNSTTDGLATEGPGRHRLLLDETNITSNGTFCSEDWDGEEAGWAWDADVVAFSLGETSRIRLVSSALLDGLWSPLREGFSTANKEGDITVVVDTFESQATYSTLLFFAKVEVTDETNAGDEGEGETISPWTARRRATERRTVRSGAFLLVE